MIGGLTVHDGNPALATHLAKLGDNEVVTFSTNGLSSITIWDAIAELRLMALGCRTTKPMLHAWASPSKSYGGREWETYWELFEGEFGLEGFPYLEVCHLKLGAGGRTATHVHRVYLRVDVDGRAVRFSYSAMRQEKLSRISEHMAAERFTSGCFNSSVIKHLRAEGRAHVADAMTKAGLADMHATPAPSSVDRAMTERLDDLSADEVWQRAAFAWRQSDNGASFVTALSERKLRIAMGTKCPVIVTPNGAVHPLLRAINKGGEFGKAEAVRKSDLDARLKTTKLIAVADLPTRAGLSPGPFAITNLHRLPLYIDREVEMPSKPEGAPSPAPMQFSSLSPEQRDALEALENVFHSGAAVRAAATRQAIEAEVIEEVRRERNERLRLRIEDETTSWDMPGIGLRGWRGEYRAGLAGLPRKYGAYLRWVEVLADDRRHVTLTSGTIVTLTPVRAWTRNPGSHDATGIMIAHAREQGWGSISINGSREWRVNMARAATRAGLGVDDEDLQSVVDAELSRMEAEKLIVIWWDCRRDLAQAPNASDALRQAYLEALNSVAAIPGVLGLISEDAQRGSLAKDLARYRQYKGAQVESSVLEVRPRLG